MKTPVTIREALPEDAESVAALLNALGYPSTTGQVARRIDEHCQKNQTTVMVAMAANSVAGLLSFHCTPLFHADGCLGRITSLVIADQHRGQGVGRQLVQAAEAFGVTHGCIKIEVTSGDHRADAHAFYERMGYHCDCRRFIKHLHDS